MIFLKLQHFHQYSSLAYLGFSLVKYVGPNSFIPWPTSKCCSFPPFKNRVISLSWSKTLTTVLIIYYWSPSTRPNNSVHRLSEISTSYDFQSVPLKIINDRVHFVLVTCLFDLHNLNINLSNFTVNDPNRGKPIENRKSQNKWYAIKYIFSFQNVKLFPMFQLWKAASISFYLRFLRSYMSNTSFLIHSTIKNDLNCFKKLE